MHHQADVKAKEGTGQAQCMHQCFWLQELVGQGQQQTPKGSAKGKDTEPIEVEQSVKGDAKGKELEPAGAQKARGKQTAATSPKEAPRRSTRSSKSAKDEEQKRAEVMQPFLGAHALLWSVVTLCWVESLNPFLLLRFASRFCVHDVTL